MERLIIYCPVVHTHNSGSAILTFSLDLRNNFHVKFAVKCFISCYWCQEHFAFFPPKIRWKFVPVISIFAAVDNLFEFLVQRNLQLIVKKEIILFGPRDETQYRLSSKSIPK